MGLGKWLVVIGLTANIVGVWLLEDIAPRDSTLHVASEPGQWLQHGSTGARARLRGKWLLAFGFALQLVGTVLWT